VLALIEIPKHGDSVLATGSSKRTIGRDRDGVNVPGVAVVVSLELELLELPHLVKSSASTHRKFKRYKKRKRSEILVIMCSLIG
jgi:hypothetical protein